MLFTTMSDLSISYILSIKQLMLKFLDQLYPQEANLRRRDSARRLTPDGVLIIS